MTTDTTRSYPRTADDAFDEEPKGIFVDAYRVPLWKRRDVRRLACLALAITVITLVVLL
jgi:hypothetical protein